MSNTKDSFDLKTFIDLFDFALGSDDPRVARALQDLLIITALIRNKEDDDSDTVYPKGPLARSLEDIELKLSSLRQRLDRLEPEMPDSYKKSTMAFPLGGFKTTLSPITIRYSSSTDDNGC